MVALQHEPESTEVVAGEPALRREAAGGLAEPFASGRAGDLLALQRRAGNRAVARLLSRQPTVAAKTRTVSLSIVVEQAMTPHEFAVRAHMQAFRMGGDVAEQRVSAIEASGRAPGTGPNFEHGVRADEVGKPLRLNYPLPALSPGEGEDVKGRETQLAGLPAAERSAIDEETDRRFWEQTGMAKGTKLSMGGGDALNRQLWMRTRDSVMRDRNRLESLPQRTRELLVPGGREVTPEQYSTVLRIADKLSTFSEEDWALYQRRINASTDDYARLEASVDRFRARQVAEAAIKGRIAGTEKLFEVYKRYQGLPENPYYTVGGGVAPAQVPGTIERIEKTKTELSEALAANHFKDVAEYEAACSEYLLLFRARAAELTLLALRASEDAVTKEAARYADPTEVTTLFNEQATLRRLNAEAWEAEKRSFPGQAQIYGAKPTAEQQAAGREGVEKRRQAEEERTKQAATRPILKDPNIHTYELSVPDEASLGAFLRKDAAARLANIRETRTRVLTDPESIYQFDRVRELTLQELGASGPGVAGRLLVEDHIKGIHTEELLLGIAAAVLAIGLGLLTFGGGTVAVLAGAGALGLSVYQAGEEWDKYEKAFAAAHTAFDPKQAVSSDDPTLIWVALSLVAIGLDGAALVRAIKAAAPAAKVLAETGSAAKFEETLAKATELSEGVQASLNKAAKAEEAFAKAAEDLSAYSATRLTALGIFDPAYLAKVTKAAYYAAAEGIRDFEVFVARLKLSKFAKGLQLEKLTAAQREALETAFKAGVKQFDTAVPAFSVEVKYASGTSKLTIGQKGELLLDGKLVGAEAEHVQVFQKLGLSHAYKGHGASRDVLTIANEAVTNAAKPKGAGISSIFSSDEAMLRSLEAAKAEAAAGKGVKSGAFTLVDLPSTPNTGRVFVAKAKLPAGVTPLDPQPFAALPNVAELPVTHVRALFTETSPGVFEIFDLFPAFK